MKTNLGTILLISFIINIANVSTAIAIDTNNWELLASHFLDPNKPQRELLLDFGFWAVIRGVKNSKINGYYDKRTLTRYLNKDADTINIPINPAWNDITSFTAKITNVHGESSYILKYQFNKNSFPMIDVLNRYGSEFSIITTNPNLSKTIQYNLVKSMYSDLDKAKNPLSAWALCMKNHGIASFSFTSDKGAFVDNLVITVVLGLNSN